MGRWTLALLLLGCMLVSGAVADPAWLGKTGGGRPVIRKYLSMFRDPSCCRARRRDIALYFRHHFGTADPLSRPFTPLAIILHATENDSETDTYDFFNSTSNEYLGGVWSHFVIAADGTINQYAPLDRASKAHFGANDLAVGIEMVGGVGDGGSLMQRYKAGDHRQLDAAIDLVRTLQKRYAVSSARVFSHQELAHIRDLKGRSPDFDWLRRSIRDRVYLGQAPDLDAHGRTGARSSRLEPYDRYDPGQGAMAAIRAGL